MDSILRNYSWVLLVIVVITVLLYLIFGENKIKTKAKEDDNSTNEEDIGELVDVSNDDDRKDDDGDDFTYNDEELVKIFRIVPTFENLMMVKDKDEAMEGIGIKLINRTTQYNHSKSTILKFYSLIEINDYDGFVEEYNNYEYTNDIANHLAVYAAFFDRLQIFEYITKRNKDTMHWDTMRAIASSRDNIRIISSIERSNKTNRRISRALSM